jgi:hypothetical protein
MKTQYIILAASVMCIASTNAFAALHGRDTTACYTHAAIIDALGSDVQNLPAEDIELIGSFCSKYLAIPENIKKHDILHSDEYYKERLAAVKLMEKVYELLMFLGKEEGVPNPKFLLTTEEAKHEWMPTLYRLTSLLDQIKPLADSNPRIAIYLKDVEKFLPEVRKHAEHMSLHGEMKHEHESDVLTDRSHAQHYGAMHPLGDAMLNILHEIRDMHQQELVDEGLALALKKQVQENNPELYTHVYVQKNADTTK